LLQELHEFYLPVAEEEGLTLDLRLEPSLPPLLGDRALLFEALANLLSNSIKFSPVGGHVILSAYRDGDDTRIEIQDSGPGIPIAEREAVFQRFYRCEGGSPKSGFGLGLSIVAAIVNLHGFKLHIGASPTGGASLILECRRGSALD
jgi:signal transduction histidine kinase